MKIIADTNVLISAVLFPNSVPANALIHISENHELVICDYIIEEFHDVIERKFPGLTPDADLLLAELSYETIIAPREASKLIDDPKDAPILNAAILENVDIIVSGDRHFLSLDIENLEIKTPQDYLASQSEHFSN
jgi:putative PIN family toxin of toxin-antitoxin system